jgi:hypothetical protein
MGLRVSSRDEIRSREMQHLSQGSTTIEAAQLQERELLTFHVVMRYPERHPGALKMHPVSEVIQYQLPEVTN